jgi:hypothetical protein
MHPLSVDGNCPTRLLGSDGGFTEEVYMGKRSHQISGERDSVLKGLVPVVNSLMTQAWTQYSSQR